MRELLLQKQTLAKMLRQLLVLFALLLIPIGAWAQSSITVAGTTVSTSGTITSDKISGSVSIDFTYNKLTLENATIKGDIIWNNTGGEALTIEMKGKNSVEGDIKSTLAAAACSLYIKKISTAESATLIYTGNNDGFNPDPDTSNGFNPTFSNTVGSVTYKYFTTKAVYKLSVAGIRVHDIEGEPGYKGNIFNDNGTPTATFDGTNTLSLNGVTLTDKIHWGENSNLTINLKGNNSIKKSPYCIDSENTNTSISFTKDNSSSDPCLLKLDCSGATVSEQRVINGFKNSADPGGTGTTLTWVIEGQDISNNIIKASVAEVFGITIASSLVTSANAGDVFGDGKVSFEPASTSNNNVNTLKLNNYDPGSNVNAEINSGLDNLTIQFEGASSIGDNGGTKGFITSTNNSAILTFKGGTGDCTLNLHASNNDAVVQGFANVTYSDGTYWNYSSDITYDTSTKQYMSRNGQLTLLTITTTPHYPIWIGATQVSLSNANDILKDGTALYISADKELKLNNCSFSSMDGIQSALDHLTISISGDNTIGATSYRGYNAIYSTLATATLTIKKADGAGSGTLSLKTYGSDPVIKGFASVSYTELNFVSKTGNSLNGATTYDATLSSETIYPLWVGGELVTESVKNGAGWSYDADSNTLTLNNYSKLDNNSHAFISNMANLNVYLAGTNIVGPYFQTSADKAFYTTYKDATLTFSTDEANKGTLDASGFNTLCEGFRDVNGIYCNNGLGYFPSERKIEAKKSPTISFLKREQTPPGTTTTDVVGTEPLTTTYGSTFYAPKPTFNNGYIDICDTTRYVYTYDVNEVVEFSVNSTDATTGKITYGEINLLKAGTVTITCSFPGNMQNNPCSASYTLKINKGTLADNEFAFGSSTYGAFIDPNGNPKDGEPSTTASAASYPALTQPMNNTTPLITDLTYESSDTEVAEISSTGVITLKGKGGPTTISATIGSKDERYNTKTASYTLSVKVPATVSFANSSASVLDTETYTQTATTAPIGATIEYSSNNSFVIANRSTGEVTIAKDAYGDPQFTPKATITATVTAVPSANPQYYYVFANDTHFQATYELTVSRVFNDITFEPGQSYATYCHSRPYDLTLPEGITAYAVKLPTNNNDNKVTLTSLDFIPGTSHTVKGNPSPNYIGVLLKRDNTSRTSFGTITINENANGDPDSDLIYLTASKNTDGRQYILYKNEFVKATGTINKPCCYLETTTTNPARGFVIEGGNDDSTAIDATLLDDGETNNEEWYDLQGRRIAKPTKAGLYIKNGKKMVINNK